MLPQGNGVQFKMPVQRMQELRINGRPTNKENKDPCITNRRGLSPVLFFHLKDKPKQNSARDVSSNGQH